MTTPRGITIAVSFEMPATYLPPFGTPLYWMDEMTGVLTKAIYAFNAHCAYPKTQKQPTDEQRQLVIAYLRYVIYAPCWEQAGGFVEELAQLRSQAATMQTEDEINAWIMGCLEIGIDPL